jgi:hypothetical protein
VNRGRCALFFDTSFAFLQSLTNRPSSSLSVVLGRGSEAEIILILSRTWFPKESGWNSDERPLSVVLGRVVLNSSPGDSWELFFLGNVSCHDFRFQ